MKVLIIGGTGLISTAITRVLQARGMDVVLYNRGESPSQLAESPQIITGDRKDFATFEAQMAEAGHFDCVFDMVCFQPEEAESTVRTFRGRTDHFIFCSTVDVYTKPASSYPVREDADRQPSPSFPYAFNKAQCERLLEAAHERGDFPVTIIRPAYTYGEGRGFLHTFFGGFYLLQRIREGRPIIVHGDGSSIWPACHRDDMGLAFANVVGNKQAQGRAYHIAGEEWMTWDQYHQGIAQAMDTGTPKLVHIPTDLLYQALPSEASWCKENFQFNNIFNNDAAAADLGFRYTIPWLEGVRRVVDWLEKHGRINADDEPEFYETLLRSWQQFNTQLVNHS